MLKESARTHTQKPAHVGYDVAELTSVWAANASVLNAVSRPSNEVEYNNLITLIQHITDSLGDLEEGKLDGLLEVALLYAGDWEEQNDSFEDLSSPRDVLEFLMQQHNLTQTDLERAGIASQPVISKVLSGEREISKGMARKLAGHFRVQPAVFF